jgi:hypothetical protein
MFSNDTLIQALMKSSKPILLICWHQDKQLSIVIPSNFSDYSLQTNKKTIKEI